jgi:hypothetical protein
MHYIKQNAKSEMPFSLKSHVLREFRLGRTWFRRVKLRLEGIKL